MAEKKVFMKGNEVIGESAIRAGCRFFSGYPITPQSELLEYMSKRMPVVGGTFIQAESEISAISMIYGAAALGVRVMTGSSGPGYSLKQEGISYLAAAQLPSVIVNVMRRGPGLGTINPSQGDYNQVTKGGGHGDYKVLAYAPATLQEIARLVGRAFEKADEYRNPVVILIDGALGQMMEPVELPEFSNENIKSKEWAIDGTRSNPIKIGMDVYLKPSYTDDMINKVKRMRKYEQMYEEFLTDDAETLFVAYGITARVVKEAVKKMRKKGEKVGLYRLISVWPFPSDRLKELAKKIKRVIVAEMSMGQMVEDVLIALRKTNIPVYLHSTVVGVVPQADEFEEMIEKVKRGQIEEVD